MNSTQRDTASSAIYLLAAASCSIFFLGQNLGPGESWSRVFLFWLVLCAVPLFFVFAYARFLFSESAPPSRRIFAAAWHSVAIVLAAVLFTVFSPSWNDLVRNADDSLVEPILVLSVLVLFSVTAVFLFFRQKSGFATLSSLLFWPYWLLFALTFEGRGVDEAGIRATSCFLFAAAPVLFVFAAGALFYRPRLAHAAALMGLIATPWLYKNVIKGNGYDNVWLFFNVPDVKWMPSLRPYASLAIAAVGLTTLALATAGVRLFPPRWRLRRSSLCEQRWLAFAVCFALLAVWFRYSVMPYRIPGAVDYSSWPVLEILHVEKHGLQFHETCVKVWDDFPYRRPSVSLTVNDRHLFQYGFRIRYASGTPSEALVERVRALTKTPDHGREDWDPAKPLRNWNADGWYVRAQGYGLRVYGTPAGSAPPQEIVALFHQLSAIPGALEPASSDLRDVCLGFCYDPLAAMGYLYANHRCSSAAKGVVCR